MAFFLAALQPILTAIASVGIAAGAVTEAGSLILGSLIIGGGLAALSGIQSLLSPGAPKPEQTEQALKTPTPPRTSGYGEGRQHMAFALFTNDAAGNAIDVGMMHDGKINRILQHYLGDVKVTVDGSGHVQTGEAGQFGQDSDIVRIFTRLGEPIETAFAEVVALIPDQWTEDHRGDGIATGCVISAPVKAKNYQMIYPTGGPNQMPLSLAMERQLVFDWRDPDQWVGDPRTWKYSENAVLHFVHYELVRKTPPPVLPPENIGYWPAIAAVYTAKWNTKLAPTLAYLTAAANDCDSPVPLKGVQTILAEAAPHGSGHITVTSVNGLATGMTIVISATGDTSLQETRTVTGIAGFVLALSSPLANDHPSGSQVTWASSSGAPATEPRYRGCVAHKHTDPHKGVVANLLACFDGWVAPRSDGALVVYSGRYYEPDALLGSDHITGYTLQEGGVGEEDAVNQIAVTYVSKNHDYSVVDTDNWEDADDIAARGKVLADSMAVQSPSFSQNRRLAKRKMAQVNAPMRGTTSTNAAGAAIVLGQRYIRQRIYDAGTEFLNAVVEIVPPVKINSQTGGVTFNWILADPNIDAWNPATEEGEPAPVGNRVATQPLDTPAITSATAVDAALSNNSDIGSSTGSGKRIQIVGTGPDRDDIVWYARWRTTGAPTWDEQQYTDTTPGSTVTLLTGFVAINATIEVEIAYQVGDGRVSDYSTSTSVHT